MSKKDKESTMLDLQELIVIRNQLLPRTYVDSEKYTLLSKAVRHLNTLIGLLEVEGRS